MNPACICGERDPFACFDTEGATQLLKCSPRALRDWTADDTGPVAVRKGTRHVRWTYRALTSWIRAHEDQGTLAAAVLARDEQIAELEREVHRLGAAMKALEAGRSSDES